MRKEARKKKKLDKTGWGIVTVVIILALLSAGWLTYRAVQVARLSWQVDVKVDGTKELKSGKASAKLLAKYAAAEPADLLTSQTAAKKRSAVLVFAGLTDSQESNEKILDYLKKAGVSAAFALPAARARENDVLIKDLVKSCQQLIGSGILGKQKAARQLKTCCLSCNWPKRAWKLRAGRILLNTASTEEQLKGSTLAAMKRTRSGKMGRKPSWGRWCKTCLKTSWMLLPIIPGAKR